MTIYSGTFSGTLLTPVEGGNDYTSNTDSGSLSVNISIDAEGDVVGSGTLTDTSVYTVPEPPPYGNYVSTNSGSDTETVGGSLETAPPGVQVGALFSIPDTEASFGGDFNNTQSEITGSIEFSDGNVVSVTLYGQPALPPIISFESGSLQVDAATGVATYTLTRGPVPLGDLGASITVSTIDGTAIAGRDYTAINEQVVFSAGQTSATVTVGISPDAADATAGINPDFEVVLSDPINASIGFGTADTTIIESTTTFVSAGQTYTVSSGHSLSGIVVESGGKLIVQSGGTAAELVISSGGTGTVSAGGTTNDTDVAGSGVLDVYGRASGTTISSGGEEVLYTGGTATGSVIEDGGGQYLSGGTAVAATVSSGGTQIVSSGGVASGTTISSGGEEVLYAGGRANGSEIVDGGGEYLSGGSAVAAAVSSGGTQIVSSGGVASGTTVSGGGQEYVYSDGVASNTTIIFSGAVEFVEVGSTDIGAQIISGGEQDIQGGAASATVINNEGLQLVGIAIVAPRGLPFDEEGVSGVASGVIVNSGGIQAVVGSVIGGGIGRRVAGGLTSATRVNSGGTETVASYGNASATTLSGGTLILYAGGVADLAIILSGGDEIVSAGGTDVGAQLSYGGVQLDYGSVESAVIGSGGTTIVGLGGAEIGTTIDLGGTGMIDRGTLALAANVPGGTVDFALGGTLQIGGTSMPPSLIIGGFLANDIIDLTSVPFSSGGFATVSGSTLDVFEGGQHYDLQLASAPTGAFMLSADAGSGTDVTPVVPTIVISSGEAIVVSSGQTPAGFQIWSGGAVEVLSGGTAIDPQVSSGGTLIVASGGIADPAIVSSGGSEVISPGGIDLGALLSGGLQIVLSGGTAESVSILQGGEQYVGAGGTTIGAVVGGGGAEVVFGTDSGAGVSGTQYDFGTALGGTTFSGGYQLVASGATASGMTVAHGGQQYVGSGGTTQAAQVAAGGAEVVFGIDSGASVSGTQYLYGTASGGTTFGGGLQLVAPGATAIGMTVGYGGEQYVGSGGTTLGAQVEAGGAEVVFGVDSGALVSGTQYLYGTGSGGTTYDGGEQLVAFGATALGMTVESGGQQYIGAGGTALGTDIAAQGVEQVFGSDSGALVSGTQYVFGIASGGTTLGGGSQQVEFGGTALGLTASSGAEQNVGAGGTASGTQIMSQGVEVVHGTDLDATISGTQYVYGVASGTVAATGGYQLVSGTISGASISGGTIELTAGGSNGTAPITFTGGGNLLLDASALFSGTIAGFGLASLNDNIDLADIPYVSAGAGATTVSWTQTTAGSGTLTVGEAGSVANIVLLGQYAQQGGFALSDGPGGSTLVTPTGQSGSITDPSPVLLTATRAT